MDRRIMMKDNEKEEMKIESIDDNLKIYKSESSLLKYSPPPPPTTTMYCVRCFKQIWR
jgi:hypothetical protein